MRAFFFGAGASVHAGYPLATELWPAMEQWVREHCPSDHIFCDCVDELNARFDLSKSFELVLTDLDNRIDVMVRDNPEKHLLLILRQTLASIIPCYFDSVRHQPAELYDAFAEEILLPGDVTITFNYDLALDRALKHSNKWTIGDGYGFEINTALFGNSPCKLFKLHGSTNWRGELFHGMLGFGQTSWSEGSLGQRPVIDSPEFEYLGYSDGLDPRCHNGRAGIESLIMPTANKKFRIDTSFGPEWQGFWDSLWLQAGEGLNRCEQVHLIGYSVPEYDARARHLLAQMISEDAEVTVCCHSGTADVVRSLIAMGLRNVRPACATTFEEWVSRMKSSPDTGARIAAVRAAVKHDFPTADIGQMLADID